MDVGGEEGMEDEAVVEFPELLSPSERGDQGRSGCFPKNFCEGVGLGEELVASDTGVEVEGNAKGVLEMVEPSSDLPKFNSAPCSIRALAASCTFFLQARYAAKATA
jgi:hypothetical protein